MTALMRLPRPRRMQYGALFDNPTSFRREWWVGGRVFVSFDANVILHRLYPGDVSSCITSYPWQPGVLHEGVRSALSHEAQELVTNLGPFGE